MILEPSNTQKPHSFEVRKKALVPPELEVYVQPSVFLAFDKEFNMYRAQKDGPAGVDIPEIHIESLLVNMDDLNEFGSDNNAS